MVNVNIKADPTLKDYFRNKERFADVINALCFNGEDIVKGCELSDEDSEVTTVFDTRDNIFSFHGSRDTLVKFSRDGYFVLIGIENQQTIDRFMPLREFLYTAFNYNRQYRDYQREKRLNRIRGTESEEFRLVPVMTPVIYYGEDNWKGSYSIMDLMHKIPTVWKNLIQDWNVRIYDIKEIDTSLLKNKDNRDLFESIVRIYNSKGKIEELYDMKMSKDVAITVAGITGMKELAEIITEEESEEVEMCRSWDIYNERIKKEALEIAMCQVETIGKIKTIKILLEQKFGEISQEVLLGIENCTSEKLDSLIINLFEMKTEQDILSIIS